jgi:hypothetical protein
MLTLGLGVTSLCEIPKEIEKPSVRRIEGRKSRFLECHHQGRGFTDMQSQRHISERFRMHRALRMV